MSPLHILIAWGVAGCAFIAAWITLGLRTHPSQHAPAEGGEGDRGGVRGLHLNRSE